MLKLKTLANLKTLALQIQKAGHLYTQLQNDCVTECHDPPTTGPS